MTTYYYKFASRQEFLDNGGKLQSEYMKNGISFSVIGERIEEIEEEIEEEIVIDFLVNTNKEVDEWS